MKTKLTYVNGHVEVYDLLGRFLFSADTIQEALEEMENQGHAA